MLHYLYHALSLSISCQSETVRCAMIGLWLFRLLFFFFFPQINNNCQLDKHIKNTRTHTHARAHTHTYIYFLFFNPQPYPPPLYYNFFFVISLYIKCKNRQYCQYMIKTTSVMLQLLFQNLQWACPLQVQGHIIVSGWVNLAVFLDQGKMLTES